MLFFTINIKRESIYIRPTYYYIGRIRVVFREIYSRIKFIGPIRASISYIAKFLVASTLRSRRDFKVFYYLNSNTRN